jgi:hypothetical protein
MRIYGTSTIRPFYLDRNAATRVNGYAATGVAPHAATSRWSYTVPAGRAAQLGPYSISSSRDTVAAAVGTVWNYVNISPAAGGSIAVNLLSLINNTLYAQQQVQVGLSGTIFAGDTVQGFTSDNSTGGAISYVNSIAIAEYDA